MKIQNGYSLKPLSQTEAAEKRDTQLRNAAKMYESHFMNEMVKAMRKTVPREDGLIKHNFAEQIFTEQLDGKYVESWSDKGGIGLADLIYNQLKDRFGGDAGKPIRAPGALPINPKKEPMGLKPTESIQMRAIPPSNGAKLEYRFQVQDPTDGVQYEAQAPLPGKVLASESLDDGWNLVKLDHGQGLLTELTFPGSVTNVSPGTEVQTGQKLGSLDSGRPVLAWKLDWT